MNEVRDAAKIANGSLGTAKGVNILPAEKTRGRAAYTPGKMNKTEIRYAEQVLQPAFLVKAISWYSFEKIKLKLADKTFYTPDFAVMHEGVLEFHEVKGFWEDDARVKIKVAAALFPHFKFIAVKPLKGGTWHREEFHG